MSVRKFNVGDAVMAGIDKEGNLSSNITYDMYNENAATGKVVEVINDTTVKVFWDEDYEYFNDKVFSQKTGGHEKYIPVEMDISALLSEEEGKAKIKSLEEAFSKLENEIEAKVNIAGDLIKQANELAGQVGVNLSQIDASYQLLKAMRDCGWRTSSMNC